MTPDAPAAILDALRTVFDPELPVNVYDLGLIYEIDAPADGDRGKVAIRMTLTAPNCPVADQIVEDVRKATLGAEGVRDVTVELTFDPKWTPAMMSDAAELELSAMGIDVSRSGSPAGSRLGGGKSRRIGLTVNREAPGRE